MAANLARQLGNLLEKTLACHQCATLHETDWVVSDDTVVRPDVLVTCEPLPDTHLESAPVLIAEVLSPATADKDRTAKLSLYQAEGVRYYAMLDPESGESELHELSSAGYRLMKGPVYRLSFAAGCIIDVDLSACLPR